MTKPKMDADRAALMERIKIATAALEIPQEAVDHVLKNGTGQHRGKALQMLLDFAAEYGISLDYLIADDLTSTFRSASLWMKATRSKAA